MHTKQPLLLVRIPLTAKTLQSSPAANLVAMVALPTAQAAEAFLGEAEAVLTVAEAVASVVASVPKVAAVEVLPEDSAAPDRSAARSKPS